MSKEGLAIVNERMKHGEFYHHQGVVANCELKRALTSGNQLYIFPIIDDIILLKKATAITAKSRTANPFLRVDALSKQLFYAEFPCLRIEKTEVNYKKELKSQPLSNEELLELRTLLPKSGETFMSIVTHDIDALHNLVFNTNYDRYLHLDFSWSRLSAIKTDLKKGSILVLSDEDKFPFEESSIDALFSFDYINESDRIDQSLAYQELKRILKPDSQSIVLYDKDKPMFVQNQQKNDNFSNKALSILAPWKKRKVPSIYFHPVKLKNDHKSNDRYLTKALLKGQLFSSK
ncbi:MAG TPA: methyltransferase domain-containing protein [Roseivirga sp.]